MNETIEKMRCISIAFSLRNQTVVPNDVHECFNIQKLPNKFMTVNTYTEIHPQQRANMHFTN